jgi:hypothetical protein
VRPAHSISVNPDNIQSTAASVLAQPLVELETGIQISSGNPEVKCGSCWPGRSTGERSQILLRLWHGLVYLSSSQKHSGEVLLAWNP